MRYSRCLMLAASVLLFCPTLRVLADDPPSCDRTFDGEWDNQWTRDENWYPDGEPDDDDVACIPADKSVEIYNGGNYVEAEAKAIVIYSGLGAAGELKIREGAILSLFEDSWVDGSLLVERGGTLELADSITIHGDGGSIQGVSAGQQGVEPLIFAVCGLTLEGDGSERSESLVLHGRFRIPFGYGTTLTNNAYVVADDADAPLSILYAEAASATSQGGHWIAENGGVLELKRKRPPVP